MISASFSLSLPSFGWKSTSTPRSRKIWTAVSDSSSDTSTRGATIGLLQSVRWDEVKGGSARKAKPVARSGRSLGKAGFLGLEGPGKPGHQRLEIRGLDRCTRPDAQAGRRIAISADVIGDTLLVEKRDHAL